MSAALQRGVRAWIVFGVLGGALAAGLHLLAPPREVLRIDSGQVARIVTWREQVLGRPLTEAERVEEIRGMEDDEILLAEARRRGYLEQGYVHGRLVKKMRFLFTERLTVPSDAELRAVYDADPASFRRPGSLAFDHVFLAPGSDVPADPEELVFEWRLQAIFDDWFGDEHPLGQKVSLRTDVQVAEALGEAFARRLLEAPLDVWVGPLTTSDGAHFARVTLRRDPSIVSFEEALPQLRGTWLIAKQREAVDRRTAELVRSYTVRLEEGE